MKYPKMPKLQARYKLPRWGIKSQANTYVCISMYANSNCSLANCQMSSKLIFCISSSHHRHCRKKKIKKK